MSHLARRVFTQTGPWTIMFWIAGCPHRTPELASLRPHSGNSPTAPQVKTPLRQKMDLPSIRIAVGERGTCALLSDHSLSCWLERSTPRRYHGSFATQLTVNRNQACTLSGALPVCTDGTTTLHPIANVGATRQLVAGWQHTCALEETGTTWCWRGTQAPQRIPLAHPQQLVAYRDTVCGISIDGWRECINLSAPGEHPDDAQRIGPGQHAASQRTWCTLDQGHVDCQGLEGTPLPPLHRPVSRLSGVIRLALDGRHGCALARDTNEPNPRVWCWGEEAWGQRGTAYPKAELSPVEIPGNLVDLAAGANRSCALTQEDQVYCWGEVAPHFLPESKTPVPAAIDSVDRLHAGADQTCARRHGRWWCWGRALEQGSLHGGTAAGGFPPPTPHRYTPTAEPELNALDELRLGGGFACGEQRNAIVCAGPPDLDQDAASVTHFAAPAPIARHSSRTKWAVGRTHVCWTTAHELRCVHGPAVDRDQSNSGISLPLASSSVVDSTEGVTELVVGNETACVLDSRNRVHCLPLEPGKTTHKIPSLTGSQQIARPGFLHVCAWLATGIRCAALEAPYDPFDLGQHLARQAGAQAPTRSRFAGTDNGFCVLGSDSSLLCSEALDAATALPSPEPLIELHAGSSHVCGLSRTGRVWCWGSNQWGQLGLGVLPYSPTPQLMPRSMDK